MKKTIVIQGLMIPEIGQRANVLVNGLWYNTSPVIRRCILPGYIMIETLNTVYEKVSA